VTNVVNGSSRRKAVKPEVPNLEIELVESPSGVSRACVEIF
jgi:hypothetical protein